ncbi:hypothetical protein BsWGS_25466 [Bradybaena similaris]
MPQCQHGLLLVVPLLLMGQLVEASMPYRAHMGSDTGFNNLCRVLCSRKQDSCPLECAFSSLEVYKKSAELNRDRRFGDFSFDDYLFLKLLGRNLDDNSE